jgi:hypothetical protein
LGLVMNEGVENAVNAYGKLVLAELGDTFE